MSWGRIDDGFDDHAKVLAILDNDDPMEAGLAIGLWTLCFTWAHRNTRKRGRTPGLLPAHLPRRFFGPAGKIGAALLVQHGLWDEVEGGGWMIHDFGDYLPTEETKAARSAAGKRGAAKRWGKTSPSAEDANDPADITADDNEPSVNGNLPSGYSNELPPSHGPATGSIANDGSRAPARRAISKEIAPEPEPIPIPEVPSSASPQTARTDDEPAGDEPTPQQRAFGIARGWIDRRKADNTPVVAGARSDPLHILRKLIEPFLVGGYTDDEIKHALVAVGEGIPSKPKLEKALAQRRTSGKAAAAGRPAGARRPDRHTNYAAMVADLQGGQP